MSQVGLHCFRIRWAQLRPLARGSSKLQYRSAHIETRVQSNTESREHSGTHMARSHVVKHCSSRKSKGMFVSRLGRNSLPRVPTDVLLFPNVWKGLQGGREIFGKSAVPSNRKSDSLELTAGRLTLEDKIALHSKIARKSKGVNNPFTNGSKQQTCLATRKDQRKATLTESRALNQSGQAAPVFTFKAHKDKITILTHSANQPTSRILMTSDSPKPASEITPTTPAQHRPLVVGLTKPARPSNTMASAEAAAALNKEIQKNVSSNTKSAAPAEEPPAQSTQPKQKKEKAPKQPKAAPAAAPTSPALIDLRVGYILRAIAHPNADSLYVSTIAMGDPEGTEHTQVDEETGKVVRTVCSGLNGLVPLAEMQDRKIIVVANLKPVNMRSIKSAAMVLAASPKQAEGTDPHAPDRVVELVMPPEGSEAGDKVYFEGWPYGEGKGPEKQLNPKKKQWEAIQPGFYTGDDLIVGFDASRCDEIDGTEKGNLVVEGKGVCTVKTLKGAVVR